MRRDDMLKLLQEYKENRIDEEMVLQKLVTEPFVDLEIAKVDLHRGIRQGLPEIIYGQDKDLEQIIHIVNAMLKANHDNIMITRLQENKAEILAETFAGSWQYNKISRLGLINPRKVEQTGEVAVICAGTSDLPVAEEAAQCLEVFGSKVTRIYDVGVSGIQRLLAQIDNIQKARVIIVIAGMEGALASVVGGLAASPIIAVPTSIGYGSNFGGLSALLTMLNSCSNGISVVNIDNGFGAAYSAHKINQMRSIDEV